MADTDREAKKEAREEKREERHEAREEKHEERQAHHGHVERLERRAARKDVKAHDEISKVKDSLERVVSKKDMNVHDAHHWLRHLGRASSRILRAHEEDLDAASDASKWVLEAQEDIFDADKQIIALEKAIRATGSRTAKDADFDKAGVADKAKAISDTLDKVLAVVPATE